MFGVVSIPQFELQAVLRQSPDTRRQAMALLDQAPTPGGSNRKCQIIQLNDLAREAGVELGMTPPQGQARCESLQFVTRSQTQEQIAQEILLQWNAAITPNLEATRPGICTVDLRGTAYDRGLEERWAQACLQILEPLHLQAGIGIAETADLALLAAQFATPIRKIPADRKARRAFLDPLAIQALGAPPEILLILERWGIRTVGALIRLPKPEVIQRLGRECLPVWERAQGVTSRPLHHFQPSSLLTEATDLEHPIEQLQALIFVLNRFLDQLTKRLEALYRVAGVMVLELRFEDGSTHEHPFRIPDPTRDRQRLFRMLHTYLENFRSLSPIIGLSLAITPTDSTQVQLSLFDTNLRDPNRFAETLARLEALLGPDRVGTPVPTASHRPDSFQLEPFQIQSPPTEEAAPHATPAEGLPLRRFRPPQPAHVTLVPTAEAEQRMRIRFAQHQALARQTIGPWLNSGHWWDQQTWDRQEWDVELENGGVYRLAYEGERWLIDGVYD